MLAQHCYAILSHVKMPKTWHIKLYSRIINELSTDSVIFQQIIDNNRKEVRIEVQYQMKHFN